jgi:hypothetical protein
MNPYSQPIPSSSRSTVDTSGISAQTAQNLQHGAKGLMHVINYFGTRRMVANTHAALDASLASMYEGFTDRAEEIQRRAGGDANARAMAARIERGRILAAGGSGASWDRLISRSFAAEGTDVATIEENRRAAQRQNVRDAEGARAQVLSQKAQLRRPNLLTLGLQLGAEAAAAASKQ